MVVCCGSFESLSETTSLVLLTVTVAQGFSSILLRRPVNTINNVRSPVNSIKNLPNKVTDTFYRCSVKSCLDNEIQTKISLT